MRFWLRYFKEKRLGFALYFLTSFLFVAVGCLYHMENLGMLLYALLMVSALWGAVGLWQGSRYVQKSRQAESVIRLMEQVYEAQAQEAGGAEGLKRAVKRGAGSAGQ